MSASNEWFEHHLTKSQGWVDGIEKIDFGGVKEKDIPNDRVLTLRFHEYLSSIHSQMQLWYEETYRSEDSDLIRSLMEKYGEMPAGYKGRNYVKR